MYEAFRYLGWPVKITIVPWARGLLEIQEGRAHGLFPTLKTVERMRVGSFSDRLYVEKLLLYVRQGSSIEFEGRIEDLAHWRFGGVRGFSYGEDFDLARKRNIISDMKLARTGEQALKMLLAKRVDVLIADKNHLQEKATKLGVVNEIKELSPVLKEVSVHLMFSKNKPKGFSIQAFNQALAKAKKINETKKEKW